MCPLTVTTTEDSHGYLHLYNLVTCSFNEWPGYTRLTCIELGQVERLIKMHLQKLFFLCFPIRYKFRLHLCYNHSLISVDILPHLTTEHVLVSFSIPF